MFEFFGELGVGLYVHLAGEHGVHGGVEVGARGVEVVGVVVGDAGVVAGLRAGDEVLHPLGVRQGGGDLSGRLLGLRRGLLRSRLLCGGREL